MLRPGNMQFNGFGPNAVWSGSVGTYLPIYDGVSLGKAFSKPGTYKIVPICRKEGDTNFNDFRICEGADKYYFTVTIAANGTASVTAHPQVKLSLQEIKLIGDQIVNKTQEIQVIVKNESPDEFAGMVRLNFSEVPEGAEKPDVRTASANILPGETCIYSNDR